MRAYNDLNFQYEKLRLACLRLCIGTLLCSESVTTTPVLTANDPRIVGWGGPTTGQGDCHPSPHIRFRE